MLWILIGCASNLCIGCIKHLDGWVVHSNRVCGQFIACTFATEHSLTGNKVHDDYDGHPKIFDSGGLVIQVDIQD